MTITRSGLKRMSSQKHTKTIHMKVGERTQESGGLTFWRGGRKKEAKEPQCNVKHRGLVEEKKIWVTPQLWLK